MPAIVGVVYVNSIATGAVFHIGDAFRVSPSSQNKTFAGAGSFNTAELLSVYNHQSNTNTYDPDFKDQVLKFNI